MFENWIEDKNEQYELYKNLGYLIGSFIDPERARKLIGDDGNTFTSTDEEFEKASAEIISKNREDIKKHKRRKRKLLETKE